MYEKQLLATPFSTIYQSQAENEVPSKIIIHFPSNSLLLYPFSSSQ